MLGFRNLNVLPKSIKSLKMHIKVGQLSSMIIINIAVRAFFDQIIIKHKYLINFKFMIIPYYQKNFI
jgi:hypothetical protein